MLLLEAVYFSTENTSIPPNYTIY